MPPDRGLGVREREQLSKEAANKALLALVHSYKSSDDPDDAFVKEAFEELASINKDQSATTAVLESWGLAVPQQPCHHARLLLGLLKHHLQSLALKPRTLVKPLKSLLRHISGAPDMKSHSSLIGETMAELVRENKFSQLMVLDIIRGALLGDHPGDMERARCFGCLAAFYMRLASFHPGSIIPMDDRAVRNCLPLLTQLLPEDMQARARCEEYFLGDILHFHSLHPLPVALGLPSSPHKRPRDPDGYFRGLLDKGQDPYYAPAPEYDPADLDPANCLPLHAVEWPTLKHASQLPQLLDDCPSWLGSPGPCVHSSEDRSYGRSAAAAPQCSMQISHGRVYALSNRSWSGHPEAHGPAHNTWPVSCSAPYALHSSPPGSLPLVTSPGRLGQPAGSFPSSSVYSFSGSSSSNSSPDRHRQHASYHSSPSHSSASSSMADFPFGRDIRATAGPPASSSSSAASPGYVRQQSSMASGHLVHRSPGQNGHVTVHHHIGRQRDRSSADGGNPFTVIRPSQLQPAAAPSQLPARSDGTARADRSASLVSPREAAAAQAQAGSVADQVSAPADQADHSARPGQRGEEAADVPAAPGLPPGEDEEAVADVLAPSTAQMQPPEQHLRKHHHVQVADRNEHLQSHAPGHQAEQPLADLPRADERASRTQTEQPELSDPLAQPQAAAALASPEYAADSAGDGGPSQAVVNAELQLQPELGEPSAAAAPETDNKADADSKSHDPAGNHVTATDAAPGLLPVNHGTDGHASEVMPAQEGAEAASAVADLNSTADHSKDSTAEGSNAAVLSDNTSDAHSPSSKTQDAFDLPAPPIAGGTSCKIPDEGSSKAGISNAVAAETADSSPAGKAADVQDPGAEQTAAGSNGVEANQATSKVSKKQRQRAKKLERELEQKLQREAEDRAIEEAIAENAALEAAAKAAAQQPQPTMAAASAQAPAQLDISSEQPAKNLLELSGSPFQNGKSKALTADELGRAYAAKHPWVSARPCSNAATSIEQALQQHFPQQDIASTVQQAKSGQHQSLLDVLPSSRPQQSHELLTSPGLLSGDSPSRLFQAQQQVTSSIDISRQQQEPPPVQPATVGAAAQQGQASGGGSKEQSAQLASELILASEPQQGQPERSKPPNTEPAIESIGDGSQATKATQTGMADVSSAPALRPQDSQSMGSAAGVSPAQAQDSQPPQQPQLTEKQKARDRKKRFEAMYADKKAQAPAGKNRRTIVSLNQEKEAEAKLLEQACNLPQQGPCDTNGISRGAAQHAQAKRGTASKQGAQKGEETTRLERLWRIIQLAMQTSSMRVNGEKENGPMRLQKVPPGNRSEADLGACTEDVTQGHRLSDSTEREIQHVLTLQRMVNQALANRDMAMAAKCQTELVRANDSLQRSTGVHLSNGTQRANGFPGVRGFPGPARSPGPGRLLNLPKGVSLAPDGPPDWTHQGTDSAVHLMLLECMDFHASCAKMDPHAAMDRLAELVEQAHIVTSFHPDPSTKEIHLQAALQCSNNGSSAETMLRKYMGLAVEARKRRKNLDEVLEQAFADLIKQAQSARAPVAKQ